ncbi:granulin b isoform X2 [Thalassophryne amazonica]|nr:granulin b isoform X2 [Thalassophryne amazonica]
MCEDNNTCCKKPEGGYGCCPLPNLRERVKAVICPDQESECPDDTTCCQLPDSTWGCCPLPKAVCCEDRRHCCPEGTQCDLKHSTCVSAAQEAFPMLKKLPSRRRTDDPGSSLDSVTCPGGKSSCPDSYTCCMLTSRDWGCCPYPEAVCCSDHLHCCPSGTKCDLIHSTCASPQGNTTVISEVSSTMIKLNRVGAVPCNDTVACADGETCCKSTSGEWACCPLPKAVCCKDHLHCCPHGTICNLAASTCDDPSGSTLMPWLSRVPTFTLATDDVKCDESKFCFGNSTCCKTNSGDWACCPLLQAVCCDDHVHCCPHGTVCNLDAETCDDPLGFLTALKWVPKVSTLPVEVPDVKCDEETLCPRGTTCCKLDSGLWACCPLPQAVCCNDHEHCCPKGYECNITEQTCGKPGGLSLPWVQKKPVLDRSPHQGAAGPSRTHNNMCDAHTSCPEGTTCCFMNNSLEWGCCPLQEAVCCSDGNHCCPSGHTCDPQRSSCSKGHLVIPWYTKQSALIEVGAVADIKCDEKGSCPSGTTCCKLTTGQWGCCPLVKAVCCEDREHCCPYGYTCNMQTGTCEKKNQDMLVHAVPMSRVLQSKFKDPQDDAHAPCDDTGEFHCPKQDTCCKISSTEWACCPSPRAICCTDSKHCCPVGYSCDLKAGGCSEQTNQTWDVLFGDRKRDLVPFGL